jgi:hypothetical protein
MARRNNLISLAAAAALTLGSASLSSVASAHAAASEGASSAGSAADQTQSYERVDSFVMFRHPYSWHPIDNRTVVLWATPFDPYLVELSYPSYDMKFVQAIGVSSFGSRVYAKFDALTIRGFRYPIDNIYKLSREEARTLEQTRIPKNS